MECFGSSRSIFVCLFALFILASMFGHFPLCIVWITEGLGPLLLSFCFARLLAKDCGILGLASLSLLCSGRRYGSFLLGIRDTC